MTTAARPASPRPSTAALAALFLGSACLAFGPMLVRLSHDIGGVGPVASAFWRMGLAVPVLAIAALWETKRAGAPALPDRLPLLPALLAGLFFAADLASWHLGIVRTTAANATLFGNCAAFLLAGWAILINGEPARRSTVAALSLAAAGMLLLLGTSAAVSPRHLTGDLLALLAALFYTLYFVVVIRLRRVLPTFTVLALCTTASALVLLPAALWLEPGPLLPQHWWPLIALACTSQIVGQSLLVFATGRLPAAIVGVGLLVQPLVAALTGWLAFGETMGLPELAGAALILTAMLLVRRG